MNTGMNNRNLNLEALIASSASYPQKISLCKEICSVNPGKAEAWCYLGYLYDKQGETRKSVRSLQKALSLRPRYLDALNCLGNACMSGEDFKGAEESFKQALLIQPEHVGILNNMGRALKASGKKELAIKYFRRAVELSPMYVQALKNLGQSWHEAMEYEESLQCFNQALTQEPEDASPYCQIGGVYKNTGKYKEAMAAYEEALRIHPDMIEALAGIAATLQADGKDDECYSLIKSMSDSQREHPVIAIIYSGLCQQYNECEDVLRLVNRILVKPGIDGWSRLQLNFSAGNICNKLKKYSDAFRYFEKGNASKVVDYQPDAIEQLFDNVMQLYTSNYLASIPSASDHSDKPVFIVGMPRSGTTLVEQVLASHPDVYGAGELPYMGDIYSRFIGKYIPGYKNIRAASIEQGFLDTVSSEYLGKINELAPDSLRVTDKMPYNFFRLGLIQVLFPGARVIHCHRDPLDVCLSCFFHDFQGSHEYAYNMSSLGHYYGQYARQMQHWNKVISLPMMDVSYESIVGETELVAKKLVEFCGLDWDDRCLLFYEHTRYVATASKNQVNKPIYSSSIRRWKHYESHLDELIEALKRNGIEAC